MKYELKKYRLLERIFSWKKIRTELEGVINSFQNEIETLNEEIKNNIETIANAKHLKDSVDELKKKLDLVESENKELNKTVGSNATLKHSNDLLYQTNNTLKSELDSKKEESIKLKNELENLKNQHITTEKEKANLVIETNKLKSDINSVNTTKGELNEIINNLQSDISKNQEIAIEDTRKLLGIFQKTTGAAGKIAEIRLDDLITKTSIDQSSWTRNLAVGSEIVEFAIKSNELEDKWIPVDSKLIGAFTDGLDENGNIIVNDKYIKRVNSRVKEVKKYLNKKNTASFGMMVLQSDLIYNEIFENSPEVLSNSIVEHSIFIMSPSAFVQFSTAVDKLTKVFDRANRAQKIEENINVVIKHINNMLSAWKIGFAKFEVINEKHIKYISNSIDKVENLKSLEYKPDEVDEEQ